MKKKCTKCDERGMIYTKCDGGIHGASCKCGKYQRVMEEEFKNWSIEDLFDYAHGRITEKKRLNKLGK